MTKPTSLEAKEEQVEGDGKKEKKAKVRLAPGTTDNLKTARMLHCSDVLLEKFEILGLMGGGGFAQVYMARDLTTNTKCAVKIESEQCDKRRMKLEMTVLALLRGRKNVPLLLGMGTCLSGHFLVMQLVGRNLSDVRRQMPGRKLSPATLFRAMTQVASAISLVHGAGFLHRDLKPSNLCIGTVDVTRIYLLDFGLTRQFLDCSGSFRRARHATGMRGTMRYISLAGHARKEFGPCNDLVAFLYSTIELGDGTLPWSRLTEEKAIEASKINTSVTKLCANHPSLVPLAEHIMSLVWNSCPDYPFIFAQLEKCLPPDMSPDDPFDWQIYPCSLSLDIIPEEKEVTAPAVSKANTLPTLSAEQVIQNVTI